jgi:transglutaminase-like putative cysteine protease/Flp pilus assembly protein TadD
MVTKRAATALLLGVVAAAAGRAADARDDAAARPAPSAPGAYEEALARAGARLGAEAATPQALAALAELAALDEDVAPAALEAAVRRGIGPGAHPLVAAQASYLLAHLLDERGAGAEAASLRAGLGFLAHPLVVGPFGEGRASFATAFPPETEHTPPEPGRSYPGKVRDVAWRSGDAAIRDGALHLDGLLRPDDQAVAYVAAFVRSDRDRSVALRLGSPGPIKVWVNGAEVLARDVLRPAALDQDAAAVRLGRGWNRILIKTVVVDGAWRLYARLTEPSGAPLRPGVELGAAPPAHASWAPAPRAGTGKQKVGVPTLDALLDKRAEKATGPSAAGAWLDLARELAFLAPRDREAHAAAAAAARSLALRPSLGAYLVAADVADTDDERRRALEGALALAQPARDDARGGQASGGEAISRAWRALLLARLGEQARTERREARATESTRAALAIDAGCWPAVLALAGEESEAGLPLAALARLQALPAAVRALPRVRRTEARLDEAAGRRQESDRVLAALGAERRQEVDLLHQLAARARARGDGQEARARLALAAELRPDLPSLALDLAKLDEGAGDSAHAVATLEALAARLPDDPTTAIALGKLLRRLGRTDEALVRLRVALALRPQDPELKRYVDWLAAGERGEPADADELARRFAADARTLVPARAPAPAAAGDTAVVLLDRRVVRVHKNGLSRTFAQRVVEVLTERGAEENKEFDVHYTPGSEEVDVRQARIYRRDARGGLEVLEATDRSDEDLSEPWYGLYYDNRAEVVRFEGLRPGDVVEIQYVVDDVGSENQMADYFGDLQYVAESIPKRRWDYTLIAPVSRQIHANQPRVARLVEKTEVEGNDRVYSFAATDVAKIDAEPAMPGTAETAPYLHVSTYATWSEVAAWYWHLVEDQLAADDDVRRTARGLVTPGMSDEARVRAVYDFVVENTRYVGLEFGIHGYKPYKVTQVLARRFGDCKDKASLLVALLREVGVEAQLVLVRTRRGGRLDAQPASLAVFDHAIVYVPKLDRYLDGTAEFAGATELPTEDQGVMVLRVGPDGGKLTETPVFPSTASRVERRWQVAVDAGGDARVDETLSIRGAAAAGWREHYQTPGARAERYGRVWDGRFPGARLGSVEMPGIGDRDAPVTVRSAVSVPRFGQPLGGRTLELPVSGRDPDFVRTYARLSARRMDLMLAYPWQHDEELTYHLPTGWRVLGGGLGRDAAREVESAFGRFHLDVSADGDVVRVRSFLDVARARIAPDEYARFRAFLGEIDAVLSTRLVVGPGEAGS